MFNLKLLCCQWASEGVPNDIICEHLADLKLVTIYDSEEDEDDIVTDFEIVGRIKDLY